MSIDLQPAPPDRLSVLHDLALLAGLGPRAAEVLEALAGTGLAAADRTCIDGGAPAVLAVRAPGRRCFDVHVRDRSGDAAENRWVGVRAGREGPDQPFRRWLFADRGGRAAELAARAADRLGVGDRFRAVHRSLGPLGRIWGVTVDDATVEVSWQLDHDVPPQEALRALGKPDAWTPAASVIGDLVDGPRTGPGPWSVGVLLTDRQPAIVRLGTSRWGRLPDDDDKIARLAKVLGRQGGDASFATAAYRLLLSAGGGRRRVVGRAVEADVLGDRVVATHAYLAVPEPAPPTPRRSTEGSLR